MSTIRFSIGPDKVTEDTRVARGDKITAQAPNSQIVQQNSDFKAAAADLDKQTVSLKDLLADYNKAHIAFQAAGSALGAGVVKWDGSYGVFTTVAAKYILDEKDANDAGLEVLLLTSSVLAAPLSIALAYRAKTNDLRIRVQRPKGMRSVATEVSTEPSNPSAWKELDGDGATHTIHNPAPGTYAVRACCKTAHARSDFFGPVTIVIK